ncbi:MAG: phosphotransferase [Anaerolineae bacterium]|nr:phosphotransferase [Anaerolineae bacterium]
MRQMAQAALKQYGLSGAQLTFLRQAGNTLFQVTDSNPVFAYRDDRYVAGRYLLRIHQPGYQTDDALDVELTWLMAMCQDEQLPVPEPVSTINGDLFARVSIPGVPGERNCSLMRWVKGRPVSTSARPSHYCAQGELMARLHQFSAHWLTPSDQNIHRYDWNGLFCDEIANGVSGLDAWNDLPKEYLPEFEMVSARTRQLMEALGKSPEVYGLIHADLGLDANILFWKGEARAIDFDDFGFGYYLYDLSLALEHCQEDAALPQYRDALLEGYTRVWSVPDEHFKHLDLFLAAFWVYLSLWAAAMIPSHPQHADQLAARMDRAFCLVKRYLNSN